MRILYWGDSPLVGTGYGRQAYGVLASLASAGHEITAVGLSSHRDATITRPQHNLTVWPIPFSGPDPFGRTAMMERVEDADVLLVIGDSWLVPPRSFIKKPIVWYTGIDLPAFEQVRPFIRDVDFCVAGNEWGRSCIQAASPKRIDIIPHGHDLSTFNSAFTYSERLRWRHEYIGASAYSVLLTNVAQNTPKKNLVNLVYGFATFKDELQVRESKTATLYLHCKPIEHDPLWDKHIDLVSAADDCGLRIGRDIVFPAEPPPFGRNSTPYDIARILACSDAFVSSSVSEGWCLPMTEAMAVGTPVIVPRTTVFPELATDRGWVYPAEETPTEGDIVNGLRAWWHARREGFVPPVIERAMEWVRRLSWDEVGPMWVRLFQDVEKTI